MLMEVNRFLRIYILILFKQENDKKIISMITYFLGKYRKNTTLKNN